MLTGVAEKQKTFVEIEFLRVEMIALEVLNLFELNFIEDKIDSCA